MFIPYYVPNTHTFYICLWLAHPLWCTITSWANVVWRYLHAVADMQFNFAWRFPESNLEIPVNECNGENDLFSIWRVIHWDELCISQTGFCFVFLRRKNISTLSSYRKVSDKTIEKKLILVTPLLTYKCFWRKHLVLRC